MKRRVLQAIALLCALTWLTASPLLAQNPEGEHDSAVAPLVTAEPTLETEAEESGHEGCGVDTAQPAQSDAAPQHFGAAFTLDTPPITVADALAKADQLKGQTLRLEGKVSAVCKKEGCWMQLDTAGATPEPMRVTFKDYGFFVPLDADGSQAILEGIIDIKVTTEAMRRHYAEDGGATPEEIAGISGDTTSVKFVATGVSLARSATP